MFRFSVECLRLLSGVISLRRERESCLWKVLAGVREWVQIAALLRVICLPCTCILRVNIDALMICANVGAPESFACIRLKCQGVVYRENKSAVVEVQVPAAWVPWKSSWER